MRFSLRTGMLIMALAFANRGQAAERVSLFQRLGTSRNCVAPATCASPPHSVPVSESIPPPIHPAAPKQPVTSGFVSVPEKLPAKLNNPPALEEPSTIPAASAELKVRRLKSRHVVLNYRLKEVGSSGVMGVEAWCTRDGQTWQKARAGLQPQGPYHLDVDEDGLYGVTLVARTGLGGGKAPPKIGDPPQFWVDVDTTKPSVVLTSVQLTAGGRMAIINWKASDNNLGLKPISLYYTDTGTGQTQSIATQLENVGTYNWQIPARAPTSIRVRVQATDQAGNAGTDDSASPVQLDLSQPEVVDVEIVAAE